MKLPPWHRIPGRRPGWVIAAVSVLVAVCLALVPGLRLETDLLALLPQDAEESMEYRRFLELFGGFEKVFILVVPRADGDAGADGALEGDLLEAADELAQRLEASPEISAIRSGLEEEEEAFFRQFVVRRAPLLLTDDQLTDLEALVQPEALDRRASELRAQLRAPTGSLQSLFAREDPLGLALRLPLVGGGGELPIDPVTGAFQSRNGDAALLVVTPAGGELDPESGRRLLADLDAAFQEIESDHPGVRCRAIGGPLYAAQDETAIRADMESTVAGSVIGVTAILLLAFSGLWVPTAAVLVLAASFAVTGAALAVGVGQLTAVGLGFAAVLVGLGVDYAIHGATRFRQARLDGAAPADALAHAVADAGPGILTSALTTAAAFATLGAAHFRPLRELGLVVATGIVAIVLMTAWLGSALLVAAGLGAPAQAQSFDEALRLAYETNPTIDAARADL
ncbi:MAG: MMPL family transporter, partial [Acidobacteriota bacterium]